MHIQNVTLRNLEPQSRGPDKYVRFDRRRVHSGVVSYSFPFLLFLSRRMDDPSLCAHSLHLTCCSMWSLAGTESVPLNGFRVVSKHRNSCRGSISTIIYCYSSKWKFRQFELFSKTFTLSSIHRVAYGHLN